MALKGTLECRWTVVPFGTLASCTTPDFLHTLKQIPTLKKTHDLFIVVRSIVSSVGNQPPSLSTFIVLETKSCAEFNNMWIVCTLLPTILLSCGDNTLKSTGSGREPVAYIRYMAGGKRKSQGLGAIARREKSRARWLAMQSKDNSSQALEELAENIARGGESSNTTPQTYVLIIDVFIWSCYSATRFMIGFEHIMLIFYIWVSNLTLAAIMIYNQYQAHFGTNCGLLTNTTMASIYTIINLVHSSMFVPVCAVQLFGCSFHPMRQTSKRQTRVWRSLLQCNLQHSHCPLLSHTCRTVHTANGF